MASTTKKKRSSTPGSEPLWPTTMRGRMSDGRLLGTDGSVWLYRAVPMDPVMDATTPRESLAPAYPIIAAYEELAAITQTNLGRRNASKGNYRQTHMLLVNIPRRYSPPPGHPNGVRLRAQFGNRATTRRILLFGVKLRGSITGNGLKSTVNSIVDTMVSGMAPLSDFDADCAVVDQALTRAGLRTPTSDDFRLANAWWNHGRAPDAPLLPHADHIHVFDTADSARAAQDAGVGSCGNWPHIQGHHAMTPISVRELDLHLDSADSHKARWVNDLLNSGALCVSIRGLVEPLKITTAELRRRQAQYREDIKERYAAGKMERADQEQTEADLTAIGAAYSTTGGPATLIDASIIAFFDGRQTDVENICTGSAVEPASMPFRQEAALGETWLASPIRANPNLHDLPVTTIAYSALPSLSRVGDKTGALLGFTERDRQPAYISHIAAAREDSTPVMLTLGSPGSGKTILMLWLADQWARAGVPQVIFDPKPTSDHSAAVLASGGTIASLDDLITGDGILDPIRSAPNPQDGIEAAGEMLLGVNPFPHGVNIFPKLMAALRIGVDLGADCIGVALTLAVEKNPDLKIVKDSVFELAEASTLFRACVGMNPGGRKLAVGEGITLIKIGNIRLPLPTPGTPMEKMSPTQRIATTVIKMVLTSSMAAMAGRDGVMHLDEAWVVLGSEPAEVDQIGRLARSMRVLPILYTQKCSDAVAAGIGSYVSRVVILALEDEIEAQAACKLANLTPTPERIDRITSKAAGTRNTLRAVKNPDTNKVVRGSVGWYVDLAGRAVTTEIVIPPEFLAQASTNATDMDTRKAAKSITVPA